MDRNDNELEKLVPFLESLVELVRGCESLLGFSVFGDLISRVCRRTKTSGRTSVNAFVCTTSSLRTEAPGGVKTAWTELQKKHSRISLITMNIHF